MGTVLRIAGTATALALVFAVAWWVGAATTAPPLPVAAGPVAAGPVAAGPAPPLPVAVAAPAPPAPTADRVALVDGYRVRLDGDLVPGAHSQVFATITRAGTAVTDLEPHLGGFGHLVAVRVDDLALLRVAPDGPPPAPDARSGPGVAFVTGAPPSGTYRVHLEFRHAGAVHTAVFTLPTREVG
jgi:hypothetical protein